MYLIAIIANAFAYDMCLHAGPEYPSCEDVCVATSTTVECDLEGGGSFTSAAELTAITTAIGSSWYFGKIDGFLSDGTEFCCDWFDVGADPEKIIVYGYDPGSATSSTMNTIDLSDLYLDVDTEVYGGGGKDVIYGGDCIAVDCGESDLIYGYGGPDDVYGGSGDDVIYGGDGYDHLYGESASDVIYTGNSAGEATSWSDYAEGGTGNGDDTIYGTANASGFYDYLLAVSPAIMRGYGGDDVLCGNTGLDRLYGGDGNDKLFGYTFADILNGGAGDHDSCEADYYDRTNCEHLLSACPAAP